MCGILAVKSRIPLPTSQHQAALDILKRRGPDLVTQKQVGTVFIAQTVLHITGTADFYHKEIPDGFSYNGEIYDHKWFGSKNNDVELAYSTAKQRPDKFRYFEGPWAWAYTVNDTLIYASDPQGEKCLYQYQVLFPWLASVLGLLNQEVCVLSIKPKFFLYGVEHVKPQSINLILTGPYQVLSKTLLLVCE